MGTANDGPQLWTMQDRLNYLFETVRPVGKPRYSVREVADAIKRDQGFDITPGYIHHICSGQRKNPGVLHVQALSTFFGVPYAFLAGDGDWTVITRQLEELRAAIAAKEALQEADEAMSDPQVRIVALKARGLPQSYLGMVSAVLDEARRQEGLAPNPENHGDRP